MVLLKVRVDVVVTELNVPDDIEDAIEEAEAMVELEEVVVVDGDVEVMEGVTVEIVEDGNVEDAVKVVEVDGVATVAVVDMEEEDM